jgi:hypothetical protein
MPHQQITPVRTRVHSTDLAVDVLRTFGYKARCACGWEGAIRDRHVLAQLDAQAHRKETHE